MTNSGTTSGGTLSSLKGAASGLFSWLGEQAGKLGSGIAEGVSNFSRQGLPVFTENLLARQAFEDQARGTSYQQTGAPRGAQNAATFEANLGAVDQLVIVGAVGLLIFALVKT